MRPQIERLARLAVVTSHFAQQVPADPRAEHQDQAGGDLEPARNGIPVGRDEQDDPGDDEHRAQRREDPEQTAALLLGSQRLNDLLPLLGADEAEFMEFLDVGEFHDGKP